MSSQNISLVSEVLTISEGDHSEYYPINFNESFLSSVKEIEDSGGNPTKKPRSLLVPILLCSMVAFGGFLLGWDVGTVGGIVNMKSFQKQFNLKYSSDSDNNDNLLIGLIISVFNIGCAIGGLLLAKLGDRYGRRGGIAVGVEVYIVGITVQVVYCKHWVGFFMGRFVAGLGIGSIAVLVPMLISENAPLAIRGAMVSIYQMMITLGILIGNMVMYLCANKAKEYPNAASLWKQPIFLGFLWALILVAGIIFSPESVPFLVNIKNDKLGARKAFARMNGVSEFDNLTTNHIGELYKEEVDRDCKNGEANPAIKNTFEFINGKPRLGFRLLTGIMVMIFQQLSGINYFFYYGTIIFKSVGLNDPYVTSLVLGTVNCISTLGGIYMVEALGRKACLIIGSVGMFCCMVMYASVGFFTQASNLTGIVLVVVTCIYIIFFATTLGPVTFVLVSELFPLRTKSVSIAVCTSFNWIFGFLISLLTPMIISRIGFLLGYFFAASLACSAIFAWYFIPETKNRTEAQIDKIYM